MSRAATRSSAGFERKILYGVVRGLTNHCTVGCDSCDGSLQSGHDTVENSSADRPGEWILDIALIQGSSEDARAEGKGDNKGVAGEHHVCYVWLAETVE
jgi:hypothetical protein